MLLQFCLFSDSQPCCMMMTENIRMVLLSQVRWRTGSHRNQWVESYWCQKLLWGPGYQWPPLRSCRFPLRRPPSSPPPQCTDGLCKAPWSAHACGRKQQQLHPCEHFWGGWIFRVLRLYFIHIFRFENPDFDNRNILTLSPRWFWLQTPHSVFWTAFSSSWGPDL